MILKLWLRAASLLAGLAALSVPLFLVGASWPLWARYGIAPLWSTEWYPYEDLFGLLPAAVGSLWALVIAMAIAVPSGLAAAIVSAEILPPRWRAASRIGMELLAGIPSVVYGLLGLGLLLPLLQRSFDTLTGHGLLAAGLLLSLMVTPTLMLMSQDALRQVRVEWRDTALHLGMDWTDRLLFVLLPQAWPGIRSGILLALGRALGETMAVMLVVGSVDRLPHPWYDVLEPAQTLTSRIGREVGEAAFGSTHFAALMACGLLLAVLTVGLGVLAHAGGGGGDSVGRGLLRPMRAPEVPQQRGASS